MTRQKRAFLIVADAEMDRDKMNYKFIFASFIIFYTVTFLFGFLVVATAPYIYPLIDTKYLSVYVDFVDILNVCVIIAGFFIVGVLAKENRFLNLLCVSALCWMSEIFGSFFFEFSYQSWLLNAPLMAVYMLAGYGLSVLRGKLVQKNTKAKSDVTT